MEVWSNIVKWWHTSTALQTIHWVDALTVTLTLLWSVEGSAMFVQGIILKFCTVLTCNELHCTVLQCSARGTKQNSVTQHNAGQGRLLSGCKCNVEESIAAYCQAASVSHSSSPNYSPSSLEATDPTVYTLLTIMDSRGTTNLKTDWCWIVLESIVTENHIVKHKLFYLPLKIAKKNGFHKKYDKFFFVSKIFHTKVKHTDNKF